MTNADAKNVVPQLPHDVVAYKRTPEFDENTVPAGLKRQHNTKAGVWGEIHILEGRLRYRRLDPLDEVEVDVSSPHIVIRPLELHEVEPLGHVRFYVQFYSHPDPENPA